MRKSILAIAAGSSVFALVAAGAFGTSVNLTGADVALLVTAEDTTVSTFDCPNTDSVAVSYGYNVTDGIADVTVTAKDGASTDTTCEATVVVTLKNTTADPDVVSTATGTMSAGVALALDLDTDFDLGNQSLEKVTVTLTPTS